MKTAKYIFYTLAALILAFCIFLFYTKKTCTVHTAVETDHLDRVVFLWLAGADLNKMENGETPLIAAIRIPNHRIAECLLTLGADADKPDEDGVTPLMHAVERGSASMVEALLEHGADINAKDAEGRSALYYVPSWRDDGMMADLLDKGAHVYNLEGKGCPALPVAAAKGIAPWVEELLAQGASPDSVDSNGVSALFLAVWSGDADCVHLLLEKGASMPYPQQLLWYAAGRRNADILKTLLEHGVRYIPTPVEHNMTALQCAALQGREEALLLLLKHQAGTPAQLNEDIDTALLRIQDKHLPVIKAILEKAKGAEKNGGF